MSKSGHVQNWQDGRGGERGVGQKIVYKDGSDEGL